MNDDEFVFPLMLGLDISSLTMSLATIGSPAGYEGSLASSVEQALAALPHLVVERIGNTVVARTEAGHAERTIVAGHLSTSTGEPDEDPTVYVEMGKLFGPGTADVKGGLAVTLKAAALDPGTRGRDVTFVFYDEPTDASTPGGLSGLAETRPELLAADFAVVLAPCQAGAGFGPSSTALEHPRAQRLVELTELPAVPLPDGGAAEAVALFERLGVAALAFGPGNPAVAGTDGEFVRTAELSQSEYVLRELLK